MTAGWTIEQACPQCGAQVELDESDRILACRFCRVRQYLVPRGRFHYVLPAAPELPADDLFYAPYWRFRGIACVCRAYDVDSRVIDASLCGARAPGLPQTLGLRPQAMKLRFALPTNTGRCLPLAVSPADFARLLAGQYMQSAEKVFFRECIGENVSLIYAPFYIGEGVLFDGVLNRPAGTAGRKFDIPQKFDGCHAGWGVSFVPTLCPNCGWDLVAEKESCVLLCPNCSRAWLPEAAGHKPVGYEILQSSAQAQRYVPFWRMRATVEGVALKSQADFIRFANFPRVASEATKRQPVSFWAPAFKVKPHLLLRLARQVMAQQPAGTFHQRLEGLDLHPVTLPPREAQECIKISLALLAARRKDVYPLLARLKITVHSHEIVYIPFAVTPHELVNETMQLAIERTALNFGRGI